MAQLGHKNRLCDAWSCASFGNKDKHNQIAGTRLRKFHRSCNTDEYIFSFRSKMLNLWNSILSSARSVLLLHMVLYSIWIREWMTEPTDCRGKGRKTWRGVYSTNFIQFQPHHLHIYVESGISRWCCAIYFHWGRFGYFLRFRLFQIPVSAPSIKWPWKLFSAPGTFTPV